MAIGAAAEVVHRAPQCASVAGPRGGVVPARVAAARQRRGDHRPDPDRRRTANRATEAQIAALKAQYKDLPAAAEPGRGHPHPDPADAERARRCCAIPDLGGQDRRRRARVGAAARHRRRSTARAARGRGEPAQHARAASARSRCRHRRSSGSVRQHPPVPQRARAMQRADARHRRSTSPAPSRRDRRDVPLATSVQAAGLHGQPGRRSPPSPTPPPPPPTRRPPRPADGESRRHDV